MTFRMAIIGTGGIAHRHARAAAAVEGVELAAICDVSGESLERFGDQYDVERRYVGLDEMLAAEDLDVGVICTWGVHHAEVGIRMAQSGKVRAILCEKPITSNAAECEEMIAAARAGGVLLAEAFKFRHHPMHLKMKEIIDSGDIGALQTIRSTFTTNVDPAAMRPELNWRFNPQQGGGAVYDLACYNIHHARFVAGAEPETAYATGTLNEVCGIHETVDIMLSFPGGVSAHISVSFRTHGSQSADVYGTRGTVTIADAWNNEDRPLSAEVRLTNGGRCRYDFAAVDQFACQLEHLRDCLRTGQPHRLAPENSLGQMRVIDAVFASMERGAAVSI